MFSSHHAPTQTDLSRYYWLMWLGFAAHIAALIWYFAYGPQRLPPLFLALSIGVLLNGAMQLKADDYYRQLCSTGLRTCVGFLAVYLLCFTAVGIYELGYSAGSYIGSGGNPTSIETTIPTALRDAYLIALLAGFAFYLGYFASLLRDRMGTNVE